MSVGRTRAPLHYADGVVDDIMVVGVGGQGVIVAAAIIADTALLHGGLEVKLSETRGMSQRGGSVSSHIRIGKTVVAPSISPGEVDYLLAFESAEGLRLAPSVVPGGVAIVNTAADRAAARLAGRARLPVRRRRAHAADGTPRASPWSTATPSPSRSATSRSPASCSWARSRRTCRSRSRPGRRRSPRNVPASWLEMNLAAFAAGREVAGT